MTQLLITGRLKMVIRPLGLACISMPEPELELISQLMIAGLLPSRSSIPLPPLFSIRQLVIVGMPPEMPDWRLPAITQLLTTGRL